jgi:hypothetical protein
MFFKSSDEVDLSRAVYRVSDEFDFLWFCTLYGFSILVIKVFDFEFVMGFDLTCLPSAVWVTKLDSEPDFFMAGLKL